MSARRSAEEAARWCLLQADGALSPAQQQALDAWLHADPEHGRQFARARRAWALVGEAAQQPRMQPMRAAARAHARRRPHRMLAWATAACALLAVFGLWWKLTPTTYQTGLAQQREVVLEDGSRIALDADTRVEVDYSNQRRALRLRQGRATFRVAKHRQWPFVVDAGASRVVATGTLFSVERFDDQIRVALYEGSVQVQASGRDPALQMASAQPLAAGQSWTVRGSGRPLIAQVDAAQDQAWRGGLLVFDDEPLAAAVARVNRYSPIQLQLADANVRQLRVSGMFNAGDSVAFVSGVTAVLPVRSQARGDKMIVLAAR